MLSASSNAARGAASAGHLGGGGNRGRGNRRDLCAEIVSDSSSAYEQSSDDWHFSFTFKVHRWVPKMHVSIAFGEPVEITQVSGGASEVDQYYYGQVDANSVVVELDEGIHNSDSEFVVMGSGTSNTSPEITCTGSEAPPPAPPHPLDCTTDPRYTIRQVSHLHQEVEVRCPLRPPSAACA